MPEKSRGKFCPKCGALASEGADFYKGFCVKCYKEMHGEEQFLKTPKKIIILQCKRCDRIFYKNELVPHTTETIEHIIIDKVKTKLYNPKYTVEIKEGSAIITAHGSLDKLGQIPAKETADVPLEFRNKTCDQCFKKTSKYYEVKIQLRHKPVTDLEKFAKLEKFIETETAYFSRKYPSNFWKEHVRDGIDFFFSSKRLGSIISGKIKNRFLIRPAKSSKLHGMTKQGKRKIKFTYCFRT